MEITVELLRKLRKAINDDYKERVEIHSELVDVHEIIDSLKELRYSEGERDILAFLEYILEDYSVAIEVLNEYLEED